MSEMILVGETTQVIVLVGTPADGYRAYGPYSSADEAVSDVESTELHSEDWSLMNLIPPEADTPVHLPNVRAVHHEEEWSE